MIVEADGPEGEPRGLRLRAHRAILAIPPALAARIAYDPPQPALRDQLTQRMPQGTVIKTMALYDEPFWRAAGFSGQAASEAGPARVVFDNSPPDGSPGVLLGFLEGRLAREWGARPAEERRAQSSRGTPASSASARRGRSVSSSASLAVRSGERAADEVIAALPG